MSVFVRELPASLAWLIILAGLMMTCGNPPRWQGVAVFASGMLALTTITLIRGRIRIRLKHSQPKELSREETPFQFWLTVCLMLFLTGSAVVNMFTAPQKLTRLLDRRYRQIEPGMHSNQVEMLMNFQAQWTTQHLAAYWDDTRLDPGRAQQMRCALRYKVPAPIRPVTFEVTFDDRGKVVGRRRHD